MRLTCPNCSARYEVDDSLIPPEGRDVQCSNCATTWFQPGNRATEEPATSASDADSTAAQSAPRRELDPALKDILREEREREEQLRRAAAPVEEQEEMALDSPPPAARMTESEDSDTPDEAAEELAAIREDMEEAQTQRGQSGRDLLPDIEEINSTLRATTDRDAAEFRTTDVDSMDVRPRRRRGFRLGFTLVILLAAAGIGAYAFAAQITDLVPQAGPFLTNYVAQVNDLRIWLDDLVQMLASQLAARAGT